MGLTKIKIGRKASDSRMDGGLSSGQETVCFGPATTGLVNGLGTVPMKQNEPLQVRATSSTTADTVCLTLK